ncbi:hypothetical protein PMKS-001232 [Pichia membranifaciens]|uniref:Uncharacterized protein n=1 Tax=Pichia membranifaciens TaxID=4926 RepID=A0A1Q2YE15_9ASCO|nr:hypothetical protein PMKS-001232 [Pichia membranifaciens]
MILTATSLPVDFWIALRTIRADARGGPAGEEGGAAGQHRRPAGGFDAGEDGVHPGGGAGEAAAAGQEDSQQRRVLVGDDGGRAGRRDGSDVQVLPRVPGDGDARPQVRERPAAHDTGDTGGVRDGSEALH